MKRIITLSILCFSSLLNAQISKELAQIVPNAPSVDGFMKHINFPVDKHTGTPTISYPIYNTTIDGIPINVSLNYHAGGIRVEERASTVGLGWNLSAGGMITRTVRGYPDDIDIGYIADGGTYNQVNRFFGLVAQYGNDYLNIPTSQRAFFVAYNKKALNGEIDTEPDIFTFNVFGLSGKFVFTPQGEITLLNKQDIKLEKTLTSSGALQNFTLTDSHGNRYYFNYSDASETEVLPKTWSSGEASLGEDYSYTSSWRLSKIKTYLGNDINFSYTAHGTTTKSLVESVSFKYNCTANGGALPQDCNTFTKTLSGTINTAGEKLITKISFDGGSIHFNYSSYTAGNYTHEKKLSSIVVKDPHSKIIKEEKLTFSTLNNESGTRRLTLASIQQYKGQEHLPKTSFEYYGTTTFPSYASKAVDLWGFYNGHSTNSSLIHKTDLPQEILSVGGSALQNTLANRNPDFNATLKGILKSVTYPTGGKTTYTYEQNDYGYDKNKALASSTNSSDGFSFNSPKITSVVSCGEIYQDPLCGTSPNPISPCTNINFPADVSTAYGQSESSKVFTAPQSYQNLFLIYASTDGSNPTDAQGVSVELQDMNGNQLYSYRNYFGTSYPTQTSPTLNWQHDPNIVKLSPGTQYRIIARSEDECNAAYISIHKVEENNNQGSTFVNHKAGGVRIKEIKKYNANNTLQLKRSYRYTIAKDSLRSSGVVKAIHKSKTTSKSYIVRKIVPVQQGCTSYLINYDTWTISSTPEVNFGNSKGSHITYRRVTEILEDFEHQKQQRIIYHYTSPYEFYTDDKIFQHTSRIDNDYRMGLEQKVELENENGQKVKETKRNFTYHTPSTNTIIGFSFFCNRYSNFNNVIGCNEGMIEPLPEAYNHEVYFYNKNTVALVKKDIENLVQENFTSATSYTYPHTNSSLPSITQTINSNGAQLSTKIYYPTDKNQLQHLSTESSQALDALVAAHRIAEPIQVISTKNNTKLSTTRANFKDWGNVVLPDTVQIAKGEKSLKAKISYLKYNNKGKPIEVSKIDGTHIVYIWGYQQQHPIAKIENATYSQVAARVADLQNKSNADTDRTFGSSGKEGILRTALASLRASLPKAMVTTFTYDPLIGVTSSTDPSGDTTYYIYDTFNRLQYIKDTNGQVLKEYRYHYKEPELVATTTSSLPALTSGQQVQLTTTATGASGNLSYTWTIANAHLNQVITNTTGVLSIATTNNHAPNFTVTCKVTDAQSNQVVSTHTQIQVTVNAAPLQVSPISYNASNYSVGSTVNYSIHVSGGSGTYKYSWSKTNSQRTYTYPNNSRTLSNRILSTDCNSFTLKCTLKDLGTGAIVTKSVKIYPTGCLQDPRGGNQR